MNINEVTIAKKKAAARRVAGILSIGLFAVLLVCVLAGHTAGFDDPIREFFYSLRSPALTHFAVVITNLANKYWFIGLCLLLLIIPQTRMTFGVPLSAGALGTILLNSIIKYFVHRPRPEVLHLVEEDGFSFTSGHSISSLFFYGLAIWLVWRYVDNRTVKWVLTILLAIPMLLVGPTRIYLGVHYPTDVLAGWCLGFAAVILIVEIISARQNRRKQ
ncbi:MAG: phosphatase PAP2 family protein [Clostridia bacterium]|nr:phosphatase PAP2 family protein [Clostridia bacterium]